jgi:hypothetical protein
MEELGSLAVQLRAVGEKQWLAGTAGADALRQELIVLAGKVNYPMKTGSLWTMPLSWSSTRLRTAPEQQSHLLPPTFKAEVSYRPGELGYLLPRLPHV